MMLTNSDSIRDVILFPTMKPLNAESKVRRRNEAISKSLSRAARMPRGLCFLEKESRWASRQLQSRSNPLMSHIRKLVSSGAHRRKSGESCVMDANCSARRSSGLSLCLLWCSVMEKSRRRLPGARLVQVSREMMDYIAPRIRPKECWRCAPGRKRLFRRF